MQLLWPYRASYNGPNAAIIKFRDKCGSFDFGYLNFARGNGKLSSTILPTGYTSANTHAAHVCIAIVRHELRTCAYVAGGRKYAASTLWIRFRRLISVAIVL